MIEIQIRYGHTYQFLFRINEKTEGVIKGFFDLNNDTIHKIKELDHKIETENEFWYLDENGFRLNDKELFAESPWEIIESTGAVRKIVQRFMNYENGEAWFALEPWFRIGDE